MNQALGFIPSVAQLPGRSRRHSRKMAIPRCEASQGQPVELVKELVGKHVVGLGMAGMDLVARVPTFPLPDSKIRTTNLEAHGGGNTANTLTAIRRLGLCTKLVSAVGSDVYGTAVLEELGTDGVDISRVLVHPSAPTSFTYVIVDSSAATRTCIATVPDDPLTVEDVSHDMLENASLVALDGRLTLAAIELAKCANEMCIPVLLDVERERAHIRELLPLANYIVTNRSYPLVFAGDAKDSLSAQVQLLEECNAEFIISTAGESGCTLVRRNTLRHRECDVPLKTKSRVVVEKVGFVEKEYEVLECAPWKADSIVDTTGAGDAFIGGICYGIVARFSLERMLCLASFVAAKKLSSTGSRSGLPRRDSVPTELLDVGISPTRH